MIVYRIINTINGKSYVGQTKYSFAHRWYQHYTYGHRCRKLYSAIKKYGKDSFVHEILGTYDAPETTDAAEIAFIKLFKTRTKLGYNIASGGTVNRNVSIETRKRISANMIGARNHQFGKKQSAETRAKRSASLKGRKRAQWVKDKIRAAHNPKSDLNLTYRRKPQSISP
jgi:group I intron endonuclease